MVGLALLRIAPLTSAPADPRSSAEPETASAMASMAARTVGISRTGHSYSPIRTTAAASLVTAFSVFGLAPCPGPVGGVDPDQVGGEPHCLGRHRAVSPAARYALS